jgi:hypothetical protein
MLIALAAAFAAETPLHDPAHPIAFGSRAGAWAGAYTAPLVGGHVKLKPTRGLGFEGFADHTLRLSDGVARHDHVIGFSAYTPKLLGSDVAFLSPTVGACVDFRVDTPTTERRPSSTDILFGLHAGLMGEVALSEGFSVESNLDAFVYWGNGLGREGWASTTSPSLRREGFGMLTVSLNYTL